MAASSNSTIYRGRNMDNIKQRVCAKAVEIKVVNSKIAMTNA